jgi:putative two-component system response regulator
LADEPKASILVVDDTPLNLQVATDVLRGEYQALAATDGLKALALLERRPDIGLILLDIMMPDMDGYEVCRRVKENPLTAHIPVIFLTALSSPDDERRAFEAGGVDFITKPFQPDTMIARVGTHMRLAQHERALDALVRERTDELQRRTTELLTTRFQIIDQLGRVAEFKDDPTGTHVIRMSHYARLLAQTIGLSDDHVDVIFEASPMHDVGKAGVSDAILRKSGPLSQAEFDEFKLHTVIGAQIIGPPTSALLEYAGVIALTHHEKWDGTGYPEGLAGEEIPLSGRIAAIADAFDALTSRRPHREAWTVEQAVETMVAAAAQHFDPDLLSAFLERMPEVTDIKQRFGAGADPAVVAGESAGLMAMRAFRAV